MKERRLVGGDRSSELLYEILLDGIIKLFRKMIQNIEQIFVYTD